MPSYRYQAVDDSGARQAGTLVADSVADARLRLRQMRVFPERVEPVERSAGGWTDRLPGRKARAAMHVSVFTRECSVLLSAGVTLADAVSVLSRQTESADFAAALQEIHEALLSGASFGDALSVHGKYFDQAYTGMITAGEKSGSLDAVMGRLAAFLERRRSMQARVSTALIYPSVLVLMVIALLLFLSGYVVPLIKPLLMQRNRPLPLTTTILFAAGDAVRNYGWLLAVLAGVALIFLGWFRKSSFGRARFDHWLLRVPLFGNVLRKDLVSRFAMSFATLLRTGVPAMEALEILTDLMPNAVFVAELARIREDVIQGKDISQRMQSGGVFPPMVGYMVAVGEHSGSLADVLEHVSEAYDMEVDIASRRMLAVLEPALILIMAGVVGFIAMSLMLTILELSNL